MHILVNEAPGVFSSPTAPVFIQEALIDVSGKREGTAFNFLDVNYIKHYSYVLYHQ